jgi:hypothetical protein
MISSQKEIESAVRGIRPVVSTTDQSLGWSASELGTPSRTVAAPVAPSSRTTASAS